MDRLDRCRLLARAMAAGSIAKAAEEVGMAPQALGRQIARLERDVGAPLLVRSSAGVRPTGLGAELVAGTEPLAVELDAVWAAAARSASGPSATAAVWAALPDGVALGVVTCGEAPALTAALG